MFDLFHRFHAEKKTQRKRMENGGEMDWRLSKPAFFWQVVVGVPKKI